MLKESLVNAELKQWVQNFHLTKSLSTSLWIQIAFDAEVGMLSVIGTQKVDAKDYWKRKCT